MPRDASGNYSLPPVYLATPGTTIRAEQHNVPLQDVAQSLSDSLPRNGSAPMTGPLAMGGRRITGLGAGTAAGDALRRDQAILTAGTQEFGRSLLNTASAGAAQALLNAVPSGRFFATPDAGGLVGGGDFTENRNIVNNWASQAEAEAGTLNTRPMSPLRTRQAIVQQRDQTALGWGQAWQSVTGSRSSNTAYQNTTGRPISVSVQGQSGLLQVSVNGTTGWVTVGNAEQNVDGRQFQTTTVPNGHHVRFTGNIFNWSELR